MRMLMLALALCGPEVLESLPEARKPEPPPFDPDDSKVRKAKAKRERRKKRNIALEKGGGR